MCIRDRYQRRVHGNEDVINVKWIDITNNNIGLDLNVFAGQTSFEKNKETLGRIYILKILDRSEQYYFYMQTLKPHEDVELCKKINVALRSADPKMLEGSMLPTSQANLWSRFWAHINPSPFHLPRSLDEGSLFENVAKEKARPILKQQFEISFKQYFLHI
eukprot:TRINITY_DN9279_c0_g1_i1.p1 TRINITY_DN9279_c0_g1~~TRINITY_DN9279_c0_g1_i1.p1  ORF type:complete len:161 (+),score=23.07 TRINITY_DN9279_c0_g1_i1:183-665(+)